MNKSIYEEAIADAQKLRELAEETAKNRVVEAVMPQIRTLVNRRILGEQVEDLEAEEDFADDSLMGVEAAVEELPAPAIDAGNEGSGSVINVSAQGDVNIDVQSGEEDEEEFVLTDMMAEALASLIRGSSSEDRRLEAIEEAIVKMRRLQERKGRARLTASQQRKLNLYFNHCLKEVMDLRNSIILSEESARNKLGPRLTEVIKEMKGMAQSNRQNIFDFLFEQDDESKDKGLEEMDLFEQDEEFDVEEEEVDVDAEAEPVEVDPVEAGDALVDLGAVLGLDISVGDQAEAEEEEDVEVGEEVDLGGEEELELEGAYEIDEGMLRRELRRMRHLREQEESSAVDASPASGGLGGDDLGDVILDISEEDLINALADEVGDVPAPVVERARRRRQPRRTRSRAPRAPRHVNEARRSAPARDSRQLSQYRNALSGMKKQLVEMNLFNAKLLYANKLMQNKDLTMKQQRAIVEALDNAKTLREAKLLYKSLSGPLARRSRGKKLNEGNLRTLGSSSRSTRSAQPAASGVEADRWAVLAGIDGKN